MTIAQLVGAGGLRSVGGKLSVYDTPHDDGRIACDTQMLPAPGGVVDAIVLTMHGSTSQTWAQTTLLDQGPGIDTPSLALRGQELAWRHDDAERTHRPLTAAQSAR